MTEITHDAKIVQVGGVFSQVRYNLLTQQNYRPYCGHATCMRRLIYTNKQFECRDHNYRTNFPDEFITAFEKFNATLQQRGEERAGDE